MKYDDEIKKALNLRAENVSVDENMLYSIKGKIKNQRRIGMNKFKKAVINTVANDQVGVEFIIQQVEQQLSEVYKQLSIFDM